MTRVASTPAARHTQILTKRTDEEPMAAPVDLAAYKDALLVLGTAGVVVPLMHRARISPVIGFLIAGAILSPKGLGVFTSQWPALGFITVSSPERVGQIAELGVVFLMFLIG